MSDDTLATSPGTEHVSDLHERAALVRTDMGGADKVARLHDEGQATVREHIDGVLDPGSFRELGTFSRSLRPEDRDRTPGDGKIGGHGTIDGRPVAVFGDDITVLRGSSSIVGTRKEHRLYERALAMGNPIVHFGQTGGARIPDTMGSEGISEVGGLFDDGDAAITRCRWPPPSWASPSAGRRSCRPCPTSW